MWVRVPLGKSHSHTMTVAAAWIRKFRDVEELVFVSDSRLSGGARTFDYCPKILTLPRTDCAIAFAGDTDDAYPLMHQLALAIQAFQPLQSRAMDLNELRPHAVKIFDSMSSSVTAGSKWLSSAADGA